MKRTTIKMDGCGRVAVPSDTANVWMSEMELVELFGVIVPTLRAAIRAVYKSEVLIPCKVERHIKLPNGYFTDVYALPMGCGYSSIHPFINTPVRSHIHTFSVRRSAFLLLRAFSFRHFKADIAHPAAFSSPSGSFAPFCIVLRIKVLTVLP